jgi:UDP-N-acetylmuramate: L-alanyl-gamma-D-glutamyl-meso-diaminopimelate ligase
LIYKWKIYDIFPDNAFFIIFGGKTTRMKIHLIAIGGSAMHNLAIALKEKGYDVSGSDDEIFEPSRSRLMRHGLLPSIMGWDAGRVNKNLDAVILGMHARTDNPELVKARELGLKIYSYPEYLYEQCKDKRRAVVAGSHGKTTVTAMVMHVLRLSGVDFDYMVGAQVDGFDTMVRLSEDAKTAVFEGDEYPSSALDPRPKFHLYRPHIALITGIAWDHINVFPTFDDYVEQFRIFTGLIEPGGELLYCADDPVLERISESVNRKHIRAWGYFTHPYEVRNGKTFLVTEQKKTVEVPFFGQHNMQNVCAALHICRELGVTDDQFYKAISTFKGAAKRLQTLAQSEHTHVFLDFAHSPSKVLATVNAVKQQYPSRTLVACLELHTFSSLSENFLSQYKGSMTGADVAWVYYNPETVKHKKLAFFEINAVYEAFGAQNLEVFTDSEVLLQKIKTMDWHNKNLLIMTSGNFNGIDFAKLDMDMKTRQVSKPHFAPSKK